MEEMEAQVRLTSSSQGIQSLETAFSILNCFKEAKAPMSVSELSKRMGMPKNKLHKYLVSFTRVGALIQNKKDSTYALGATLIELGLVALQQFDVVKIAKPYIREFGKQLNHSVALAIWSDDGPMIAEYERSDKPIQVEIQAGYRLPLLMTALGKCFAAFLPPAQVQPLLQQEIRKYGLDNHMVDEELKKIRGARVSFRNTPFAGIPGSMSVASPIFDYTGNMVAALCLIGFAGEIDFSQSSAEVIRLIEKADQITNLLT
ncbi:IclR family transcriptional regulator [Paenibacillus sp. WQ 127069]|uniref:IclR family transcriptional regulator n=1 Tax=Paenibacillus baimaensis TaxID=2982185 RepID=A0ABT2UKT6_9BACL|nr:IclR family transcriptional regulator [Paenibacillus sp. WQ 127069]MCU6794487.1 IclR family transcriptional regulator [Paenibacillus sp. WQ 127069]